MEIIEIEKMFDDFLLCEVEITHIDRLLRKGELKMVSVKNHNVKFFIDTPTGIKTLECFYPFSYKQSKDEVVLSYFVSSLEKNNNTKLQLKLEKFPEHSKFLNSKITIKRTKNDRLS